MIEDRDRYVYIGDVIYNSKFKKYYHLYFNTKIKLYQWRDWKTGKITNEGFDNSLYPVHLRSYQIKVDYIKSPLWKVLNGEVPKEI